MTFFSDDISYHFLWFLKIKIKNKMENKKKKFFLLIFKYQL